MSKALKVALVTGAGSGIGTAASLALAAEGFAVVLAGRRAEPLTQLASEITERGERALAVPTDVSSPQATHALFEHIREEFGRLDVLFNNAGIGSRRAAGGPDASSSGSRSSTSTSPALPLHAGGVSSHEEPDPARRPHHQQWLDLGP